MPPRKEPKEQVTYPSSKRKTPAFKPLRPSKVAQTESGNSARSSAAAPKKAPLKAKQKTLADIDSSDEGDSADNDSSNEADGGHKKKSGASTRPLTTRQVSPMSISSQDGDDGSPDKTKNHGQPMPSQSDDIPSIPQPLLIRLLHEGFTDPKTKIDRHAVQVLQKYMEVFVREAIARCQLDKKEAADRGDISEQDAAWLELEDLEKASPSLMLDF